MAQKTASWLSTIDRLIEVHARMMRVQIEHVDFRRVIDTYDSEDSLFYLDPPYVPETRRGGEYKHELTAEDHVALVDRLSSIKGKVLLSGYPNDLYKPLEKAGWKRKDFEVCCNAVARTRGTGLLGSGALKAQKRVESVWISPRALKGRRKAKIARPSIHYKLAPRRARMAA